MYKVLIVEDDPMVAMINEQYIMRNGNFEIVGKCRDGLSALDFLQDNAVDLLILDVFMPKMDGFEMLREIRRRHLTLDAILVTAANERESLEEALHLGIVDYLVKPFTFDRFQKALEKYIAHNSALSEIDTLNQNRIDRIIDNSQKRNDGLFPKGIQEQTLARILAYLRIHKNSWLISNDIANEVGLTGVTVRRYMNYLVESGEVVGKMNYETGGRPCMQYKLD